MGKNTKWSWREFLSDSRVGVRGGFHKQKDSVKNISSSPAHLLFQLLWGLGLFKSSKIAGAATTVRQRLLTLNTVMSWSLWALKEAGEEHSLPENVGLITQRRVCFSSAGADRNIEGRPEVLGDSSSALSMKTKWMTCIKILRYCMYECMNNWCLVNLQNANLLI